MKRLLVYLSFLVPGSLLTTKFLHERLTYLFADPATCDHEWHVVASILNDVELQVQCFTCGTYSEVPDPSQEEWDQSYGAMENPYPWEDVTRIRLYQGGGQIH
ncbi:MAG: hypothetical protein GY947_13840 [Rhodobacteraceae bacterium]|nr:hypothetical protein [Paracoccaceae bacterium]